MLAEVANGWQSVTRSCLTVTDLVGRTVTAVLSRVTVVVAVTATVDTLLAERTIFRASAVRSARVGQ